MLTTIIICLSCLFGLSSLDAVPVREVVVGFDRAYPPYEFVDSSGNSDGFNIALMKEIARRNQWKLVIRQTDWSTIRAEHDTGKIDLIAGLIRTEQRIEKYAFSIPHTYVHYSIFHRIGKDNIDRWDGLNDQEILVELSDVIDEILTKNAPYAKKVFVQDYIVALTKLAEGVADIAILPRLLGHGYIIDNDLKSIELSATLDFAYPYCVSALSQNAHLLEEIDETLSQMEEDGSLLKLRRKWFSTQTEQIRYNGIFNRKSAYLFLIFACICFILIAFMLSYYRNSLRYQTQLLNQQIIEKNRKNSELETIHRLYQEGPIIVMKWYDTEKEQFSFVTDNISTLGYEAKDILSGKINYRDIIHPEDVNAVRTENYKILLSDTKHFQQNYRVICPSNEITGDDSPAYLLLKQRNPALIAANSCKLKWVLDYTVQVNDSEKDLRYYYGYLIDVTNLYQRYSELNRNRKLAEVAEKSKDIFLSSITDEISVPIREMLAAITDVTHSSLDEEQQDSLMKLYLSAHRLNLVIAQIQSFLYYSSSAVEMHTAWFNPAAFIERLIPLMSAKADAKNIRFEYVSCQDDTLIFYSSKYLADIVSIIFDNALKFSDKGVIHLECEIEALAGADAMFKLCITDEGIGLPEEKMDFILEPFTQIDASYTRERGGLGLGLATLKHIMKISDGEIKIKNRSRGGVEVCVEWMVACRPDDS